MSKHIDKQPTSVCTDIQAMDVCVVAVVVFGGVIGVNCDMM